MKENKWLQKVRRFERSSYFFWVIFTLALVVIGESVWLVAKLDFNNSRLYKAVSQVPQVLVRQEPPVAVISLEPLQPVSAGKVGSVEIILSAKKNISFQGLDVFVDYNPSEVQIIDDDASQSGTQVQAISKPIGRLARNLVQKNKGRILLSWVQLDSAGTQLLAGDRLKLAKINFRPMAATANFRVRIAKRTGAGSKMTAVLPDNRTLPLAGKDLQLRIAGQKK